MKVMGLLIFLSFIGVAIILGGNISMFFDMPSLVLVVVLTMALMVYKYGAKGLVFWKLEENKRREIAHWSGRMCLHVGLFCALLGWIIMGVSVTDIKLFGRAMSVSLLAIFYCYILYFSVFAPYAAKDIK